MLLLMQLLAIPKLPLAMLCCAVQAQMLAVEQQLVAFKAAMDAGEAAASKLQVRWGSCHHQAVTQAHVPAGCQLCAEHVMTSWMYVLDTIPSCNAAICPAAD
jgi:hypothetical protein